MNNEIRLIKKEKERDAEPVFTTQKKEVITPNSPIIKQLKEAEAKYKSRRELSDDDLIELEFKEEADKIRALMANSFTNDEDDESSDSKSNPSDSLVVNKEIPIDDKNLAYIRDLDEPNIDSISSNNEIRLRFNKDKSFSSSYTPSRVPLSRESLRKFDVDSLESTSSNSLNIKVKPDTSTIIKRVDIKPDSTSNVNSMDHNHDNKYQDDVSSQDDNVAVTLDSEVQDVYSSDNIQYNYSFSTQDSGEFILPHIDLLNKPQYQKVDIDGSEIDIKAHNLISKLRVFRINGDITDIYSGPVVTTFEFRPAPDVKVSRIQNLENDLSMTLKAKSIRIQAPIPGKDVVGIEIPNNTIQTIYIREIFESEEFLNSDAQLAIALGKDIIGKPVVQDLAKLPHLLIAGTTGSGKSVGLNGMILSLLYKNTPDDLRFIMIDPKRVELSLYKDIPHLLTPIIADSKKAVIALSRAVDEMNRRYELLNDAGVKNIIGYNDLAKVKGFDKLPYIVIIIDEFADLMIMGGKDAEQYLISLASKARASGIHLIIATQRPTVNVVTGLIKSNLPSKISYRVGGPMDSKVILDRTGAETLLGNGDMLFSNTNTVSRFHAPYSHEKEIERVADFIRSQKSVEYDDFFSLEQKENNISPVAGVQPLSEDEYMQKAKEIILSSRRTSASYLQRALGIGFNRASNILESLEKEGFLSAPNSKNLREIIG